MAAQSAQFLCKVRGGCGVAAASSLVAAAELANLWVLRQALWQRSVQPPRPGGGPCHCWQHLANLVRKLDTNTTTTIPTAACCAAQAASCMFVLPSLQIQMQHNPWEAGYLLQPVCPYPCICTHHACCTSPAYPSQAPADTHLKNRWCVELVGWGG